MGKQQGAPLRRTGAEALDRAWFGDRSWSFLVRVLPERGVRRSWSAAAQLPLWNHAPTCGARAWSSSRRIPPVPKAVEGYRSPGRFARWGVVRENPNPEFGNDLPVDVGQAPIDAVVIKVSFLVIDAEEMQDRGVEVRNGDLVVSHEVSQLVRGSIVVPAFTHPARKQVNTLGWWSRPVEFSPWVTGLRPNSVFQTSSVSSEARDP